MIYDYNTRAKNNNCLCCNAPINKGEYCHKCLPEMRRIFAEQTSRENQYNWNFDRAEFEIIEDMIQQEVGGLTPGSKITRDSMVKMLNDKVLAKGTTVKHIPTGEIYHVDYGSAS